jgi:hypothetical protein
MVLDLVESFFPELQTVASLEAIVIFKGLISSLKDVLLNFVIVFVKEPFGYSPREYSDERRPGLAGICEDINKFLCPWTVTGSADDKEGLDSIRNQRSISCKIGFKRLVDLS